MTDFNYRKGVSKRIDAGTYEAKITEVIPHQNDYYDPIKENSAPFRLEIDFLIEDKETLEEKTFKDFINALAIEGLPFDQLCTICIPNYDRENEDITIDSDSFIGKKVNIEIKEVTFKNRNGEKQSRMQIVNVSEIKNN